MIRLDRISKRFGDKSALESLSLEVGRGEIVGLLGHNGAGKSTALGVLLGQVFPDAGEAFVGGFSVQKNRRRALAKTGAIFEQPRFYDYLSGWTNLELFAAYSGPVRGAEIAAAADTVGLGERIRDKVGTYSQGMRQRLGLAQALLPEPEVVLLDEPTNGLDPEGIHEMRGLIRKLSADRGLTMLFCSHLLGEVEQLCDRVAILNRGRLVFAGRWGDLARGSRRYRLELGEPQKAAAILERVKRVAENVIEIGDGDDIADIVGALADAGAKVRAVEPLRQHLEELYLETVTGR